MKADASHSSSQTSRPEVSVITVFRERRDLCRSFLHHWTTDQGSVPRACELLFADNASTDGTRELLTAWTNPRAHIAAFDENLGYARANNRLAARARSDLLVFLNYDVHLPAGWLEPILEAFCERPTLGIVGNVQLSVRTREPDHAGIFFDRDGSPFHFRPGLTALHGLDLLPVPAVTGACLAIRRALFEKIGGFHEGYRNSYEDIELCLQARRLDHEIAVATRSIIWHYIGASPGRQDRESANARLFEERCGTLARRLAKHQPPDLAPWPQHVAPEVAARRSYEMLQVFYDRGAGFAEADSTVHLVERGRWNRIEIALAGPGGTTPTSIRLDPGLSPGTYRFGGLALKSGPTRVCLGHLRGRQLATQAVVGGTCRPIDDARALTLESTGLDPHATFRLADLFSVIPDGAVLDLWLWAGSRDDRARSDAGPAAPSARRRTIGAGFLRRTRVLVDLLRLSPGGVNGGVKVLVLELLEAIARRSRFRLAIHVLASPEVCREIASTAPTLSCHPCDASVSVHKLLSTLRADVLYAPLGCSSLSRPDLPQVSLMVDFLHRDIAGALPEDEVAARETWMIETLARSAVLQCNSRFVVERLHHHYGRPAAATLVVYNAVGQTPRERVRVPGVTPYFFYPANDWPHKNHERLLEAYALYCRAQPAPWHLKLSGHFAEPDRIAAAIARHGVETQVEVLGHVPDRDYNRIFSTAGALVFPSRYEGFGIPVLEAFRLGVPVICSQAGSLPEIGADACGYFDPNNAREIAAAMERIATEPGWRDALVAAGHRRARDFDLAREAARLGDTFLRVARQARG